MMVKSSTFNARRLVASPRRPRAREKEAVNMALPLDAVDDSSPDDEIEEPF
jgi:hypothetical protein